MKMTTRIFALFLTFTILSGCAATRQARQLALHQLTLSTIAQRDVHAEEKLDVLATSLVQMMKESLRIVNPNKALEYVTKYAADNEEAIDTILSDVSKWQDDLNILEKVAVGARLLNKPYINDFTDLFPKFRRKYKQLKFLYKLGSFFGMV